MTTPKLILNEKDLNEILKTGKLIKDGKTISFINESWVIVPNAIIEDGSPLNRLQRSQYNIKFKECTFSSNVVIDFQNARIKCTFNDCIFEEKLELDNITITLFEQANCTFLKDLVFHFKYGHDPIISNFKIAGKLKVIQDQGNLTIEKINVDTEPQGWLDVSSCSLNVMGISDCKFQRIDLGGKLKNSRLLSRLMSLY